MEELKRYKIWGDLNFDADSQNEVVNSMLKGGKGIEWEKPLDDWIKANVQPNWHVVDIGANMGVYTLLLAKTVNAGRVMAFEPDPAMCELVQHNLQLNGLTANVRQLAVSNVRQDDVPFISSRFASHGNKLLKYCQLQPKDHGNLRRTELRLCRNGYQSSSVCTTTLDYELVGWPNVDFIKIDAEGAELDIWRGSSKCRKLFNPWIVLEWNTTRFQDEIDDWFFELYKEKYSVWLLKETGPWKINLAEHLEDYTGAKCCNLLLHREDD